MAKPRKNSTAAAAANNNSNSTSTNTGNGAGDLAARANKPKRTRKSVPRESPSQRSSVYRGVTRFVLYYIAVYIREPWPAHQLLLPKRRAGH